MEPTEASGQIAAYDPPPFRMTISSRFEAYCPCCGYALQGIGAMLVVPDPPSSCGAVCIAVVCRICYGAHHEKALIAASTLLNPRIDDVCTSTGFVGFYCPRSDAEKGHSIAAVLYSRKAGEPLPLFPIFEPPPFHSPPPEPTLFEQRRSPQLTSDDRPRTPQLPHG